MKPGRSRLIKLLRYALPLLFVTIIVVMVKWMGYEIQGGANIVRTSTFDERPIARPVELQGKPERRWDAGRPKGDFPIYKLPVKLRRIASDFEARSLFMESSLGFTNEEQLVAMGKCREIIDGLAAAEVVALMEYYRDPLTQKLSVNGNELVGPLLYERWGEVDSYGAVSWIETQLESTVAGSPDPVDVADPFAMSPSCSDIAHVFAGWAEVDAAIALSNWERIHANLKDRAVLNLADLDNRVRSAINEGSQSSLK